MQGYDLQNHKILNILIISMIIMMTGLISMIGLS